MQGIEPVTRLFGVVLMPVGVLSTQGCMQCLGRSIFSVLQHDFVVFQHGKNAPASALHAPLCAAHTHRHKHWLHQKVS